MSTPPPALSSSSYDALSSNLQSLANQFLALGREQERVAWKALVDKMLAKLRHREQEIEELRARCHHLEQEASYQVELTKEASYQAFELQRGLTEDLDSLQRIVLSLKLSRPGWLDAVQACIASGDMETLQDAFNAWSGVDDNKDKATLDSLLRKAAEFNQLEIGRMLLAWSASPAAADAATGRNALHLASQAPGIDEGLLEELLHDAAAHVDNVDTELSTPLMLAAKSHKEARVKALLRRGADPELVDAGNKSACDYATGPCQVALTAGPDLFASSLQRASKLLASGDYEATLRVCQQGLLNTTWGAPHESVFELCMSAAHAGIKTGRYCEAVDRCQQALKIQPGSAAALSMRAEASMRVFDFEQALHDYEQLGQHHGHDCKTQVLRIKDFCAKLHDYYRILDLDASCSPAELRRAYLQKCLRWHPDKNQATRESGAQASTMFKAVCEANRVLSDPLKRAAYDAEHGNKRGRAEYEGYEFFTSSSRKFPREMSPKREQDE